MSEYVPKTKYVSKKKKAEDVEDGEGKPLIERTKKELAAIAAPFMEALGEDAPKSILSKSKAVIVEFIEASREAAKKAE